MSRVGQKDTGPEMRLRKALHSLGLRYRLHDKKLPGSPDIVFPRYRAVLFVHGCFWHRHGCKASTTPKTRRDFWDAKFLANINRDLRNSEALLQKGWRVMIIWECTLKGRSVFPELVARQVREWLKSDRQFTEYGGQEEQ